MRDTARLMFAEYEVQVRKSEILCLGKKYSHHLSLNK